MHEFAKTKNVYMMTKSKIATKVVDEFLYEKMRGGNGAERKKINIEPMQEVV